MVLPFTSLTSVGSDLRFSPRSRSKFSLRPKIPTLTAVVILLLSSSSHFAGAFGNDYVLDLSTDVAPPGGNATIGVDLSIDESSDPIVGWSFGICHDSSELQPVEASLGSAALDASDGMPVEFSETFFDGGSSTSAGGVIHSATVCFSSCAGLSPGATHRLLDVVYSTTAPSGTMSELVLCANADVPGVPTVPLRVYRSLTGSISTPTRYPGAVFVVDDAGPTSLSFDTHAVAAVGSIAEMDCILTIEQGAVSGWSIGVCHDASEVRPVFAEGGVDIAFANNGAPPDFNSITWEAGGATSAGGVVQGAVLCFGSCVALSPGTYNVLSIGYEVLAPAGTVSTVSYCDTTEVGIPSTPTLLVVSGQSQFPARFPGTITVASGEFIRGDVNDDAIVDLADAQSILSMLFEGGSEACLDSSDANDDGFIDVADGVRILQFLFEGGLPLSAPFPACGDDRTVDTLDCSGGSAC